MTSLMGELVDDIEHSIFPSIAGVAGADAMIERVVADIPDAEHGFTLIFSSTPFPGQQYRLDWQREESGGNWYYTEQLDITRR